MLVLEEAELVPDCCDIKGVKEEGLREATRADLLNCLEGESA